MATSPAPTQQSTYQPYRKIERRNGPQRPTLAEPVEIGRWFKNRRHDVVSLRLSTFEGVNIVDLRTWTSGADGILRPGKGFACHIKQVARLAKMFVEAIEKARELGLVGDEAWS